MSDTKLEVFNPLESEVTRFAGCPWLNVAIIPDDTGVLAVVLEVQAALRRHIGVTLESAVQLLRDTSDADLRGPHGADSFLHRAEQVPVPAGMAKSLPRFCAVLKHVERTLERERSAFDPFDCETLQEALEMARIHDDWAEQMPQLMRKRAEARKWVSQQVRKRAQNQADRQRRARLRRVKAH